VQCLTALRIAPDPLQWAALSCSVLPSRSRPAKMY
jgi:hypothetical protein